MGWAFFFGLIAIGAAIAAIVGFVNDDDQVT